MSKYFYIFIVVLMSVFGVLGDYFIKLSGHSQKYILVKWFILGLSVYSLSAFGWFFVMKHIKLSTLGVYYALTTVILLVAVGVFVFKETLNASEIIGVLLAVASLILLARFA